MKIKGTVNKYPQQIEVGAEVVTKLGQVLYVNPTKFEVEGARFAKVVKIEAVRVRERQTPARKITFEEGFEAVVLTRHKIIVKEEA